MPLLTVSLNKCMIERRKICPTCHLRPVAVNKHNHNTGRIYYRKLCDACIRIGKKVPPQLQGWIKAGYRKKTLCERCGFKVKYPEQSSVFHIDGDLRNCDHNNLKTVCLNCRVELQYSKLHWRESNVRSD
jgi:hypothetical protein